jgi:hypothetical protein
LDIADKFVFNSFSFTLTSQDSSSSCSDKTKSTAEKPSWVDNELYYSEEACQNFNQEELEAQEAGKITLKTKNLITELPLAISTNLTLFLQWFVG